MKKLLLTATALGLFHALPAASATIIDWSTSNVDVGSTPPDGVTGSSTVYDQILPLGEPVPTDATSSGRIAFTPPEAFSPGIRVSNDAYPDSGTGSPPTMLDGCILSSSTADCDSPFQSGKRIKQVMTGPGPVDLVFTIDPTQSALSTYQVYGRLINQTGGSLDGFQLSLGYGIGNDFVVASETGGLTFSTTFTAQPSGSGSSATQFPFGLFGAAETNPNFLLDGFFADMRTGLELDQTTTTLTSTDYFGTYADLFGPWMTQDEAVLPSGLFWDFDNDSTTEDMLMAWEISDGLWELRREAVEFCDPSDPTFCSAGSTLDSYFTGTLDEVMAQLGVDPSTTTTGVIEDLANLNVNYAIALGDLSAERGISIFDQATPTFTLRAQVFPTQPVAAVPLPAGAPLLLAGLGLIGLLRRRNAA